MLENVVGCLHPSLDEQDQVAGGGQGVLGGGVLPVFFSVNVTVTLSLYLKISTRCHVLGDALSLSWGLQFVIFLF